MRNYGKRYYYSFEQGVPDEYLCKWIAALYTQIKKVFDEFQPNTIILPNLVSASHLITYYLAKKRNVKVISINDTKVQPYYSVVHCPFNADSDFVTRLNEMLENREVPKDLEKVRSYIKEASEKVKAPPYMKRNVNKISLANEFNVIKNIVKQIIMYYAKYDALRIYKIENLGPNIDYKTPYILMRDYWVSRINTYKVKKLKYNDVRKVGRFAYFPLQVQPEATLEIQAPWFANQIETIRNIAMSLPEDMTLVVKEHPEMIGKRYPSYYRKIQKSLNVKLVSSDVPQEYLLKNCDVLIGTNGTVICEAAFSRTPVIQLGLVGMMHKLPNVVHHTDLSTIPQAVRKALSVETHSEEYDRQLECYVGAAFEAGFKMDYTSVWVSADQNALDELYSIFKGAILNELQRQKTAS